MTGNVRHEIDDTPQVRPHVRLCHQMLSEGLTSGFSAVELTPVPDAMPQARVQSAGSWKPYMAFPKAAYSQIVSRLREMAGLAPDEADGDGAILVRWSGREASIALRAQRNEHGEERILLTFPAGAAT